MMSKVTKKKKRDPAMYIEKRRFGGAGPDQSDESSDDAQNPALVDKTPNTRKKIKDESAKKEVKKLGMCGTYLTLIKGFVCTSIIYLPNTFYTTGYGFNIISLTLSACLTSVCAKLLMEVRDKMNTNSYTEIGIKLFGAKGKHIVSIALGFSQTGFVCAYIYFIAFNFHDMAMSAFGLDINRWVFAWGCFVLFSLLSFVRKIQIFASTHVFADVMIVLMLIYIVV